MREGRPESRWTALRRRSWTVPFIVVFFLAATVTLPLLLLVTLSVDAVRWALHRRTFVVARAVLFGWVYLAAEVWALTVLLLVWFVTGFGLWRTAELALTYRLQARWAAILFGAVRRIFSMGLEVEDDDLVVPGPVVVMVRHASLIDTLLPNNLITRRWGLLLRYVLKNELLYDPALDIAGHRLVNHFVERVGDSAEQVERVRELSRDLGPNEGVLIYPEGTRFTEEKRARVLERLRGIDPVLAARAEQFHNVLPPRLGGPMALLDPFTPCDVVMVAHVGLDGLATVKHLLDGTVVGNTIRVRFWRIPREEIPAGAEAGIAWLFDRWKSVDDWIAAHRVT
ncbi:MAG: 1-acyl-sn-glycerol-3-phosphate acyltransferase [Actinobacteria bacterium]|nr:1-acyl-sn-glycerol-3-phosphate acyltransferase [Actinomycetota bacterium]